jgi:integrase
MTAKLRVAEVARDQANDVVEVLVEVHLLGLVHVASLARGEQIRYRISGGWVRHVLMMPFARRTRNKAPKLPKVEVPDPKWDHLNVDEAAKIIAATRSPEERALILFVLRTGLRAGEQRALEWGDLDWVNHRVVVRKPMSVRSTEVGPPKSGRERFVPMSPELEAALKAIRGLQHLQGGFVFTHGDGKPYSLDQLHERLRGACRRAGVREVRWHDLRRSFASQLIAAGVDIVRVQRWLGHASITMTMRYAHIAPGSGDAIAVLDRRGSGVAAAFERTTK